MRDFDELKLAFVIDACGGITGRVKMQKVVYLLRMMGYDLPFDDFVIRQQGPFSRCVAAATDVLKGTGILEESVEELGSNTDGDPVRQYSYRVRDDIAPLIRESFQVLPPPGKPKLFLVVERLKDQQRAVLEVAATRVYLEREGLRGDVLEKELLRLKSHLREHLDEANALLEELAAESLLER